MAVIHMDSEELSQLAERMKASIRKISAASDRVLSKVNRLSTKWYGGTADHFIDQANDHLDSFSGTINQLDTLRFQLLVEIDQWLNADLNDSYQIRSAIHAAITSPSGSTIPGYEYEMDKIIRDADVDGKEFLWRGIMISATGGSFAGLGAAGLYSGLNVDYKDAYLDYSYDELLKIYGMAEDGTLPKGWPSPETQEIVKSKWTIYEKDFGTAQAAVFSGEAGSEALGVDYAFLSAEASGQASLEMDKGKFKAGAAGEAGVYLAKASVNASGEIPLGAATAGLAAAGTSYMGAEVCGEAGIVFDPKSGDAALEIGGEAFAGGKVEGELEGSLDVGGVEGKVKGSASLNYGIGAQANADIGFDQGTLKADIQIGATLGLGFDVGVSFELDTSGIINNLFNTNQLAASMV